MSETILKCENLCKHFGKKQILDRVSLEVKQGDILGFIGPNGAGKTTTIKLILGLQSIDSGTVKINGYDIQKDFEKAIEKAGAKITNSDYMYFDTGNLNYYQTNGFSAYKNAKKCYFDIPAQLKHKYHAQESLNSTIQLLLEVE